jgi:hypothetical protein
VVAGPPLRQVGAALAHADPGGVVLSPEAARILGERAAGRVLADAHLELAELAPLARTSQDPLSIDVAAPSISRPSCRAQSGSASRRARPTGSVSCAG